MTITYTNEQLKQKLGYFGITTNRSAEQEVFLYHLCDDNFVKLTLLEERIANLFLFYCPGDKQEVEKILNTNCSSTRVSFREWRVELDTPWSLKWQDENANIFFTHIPKGENRRDVIDNRRGEEWKYHYGVDEKYNKSGLEINIFNGQVQLLTNNLKMTIHKDLECPMCHIVQKAEIFSSGNDIKTAVVENITFGRCRHYIFAKDMIRDILRSEDKPHPKEQSINEFQWPKQGRLFHSETYHSGAGVIVDKDTWDWYYSGLKGPDYVLTEEETNMLLKANFPTKVEKFNSHLV